MKNTTEPIIQKPNTTFLQDPLGGFSYKSCVDQKKNSIKFSEARRQ